MAHADDGPPATAGGSDIALNAANGCARFQYIASAKYVVTSSCLCKKSEGAGFPFQVKAMEDGVDDSVDTLHVHKADHRTGPPPHFYETTFDNVGSPQLFPQMWWKTEKRQ